MIALVISPLSLYFGVPFAKYSTTTLSKELPDSNSKVSKMNFSYPTKDLSSIIISPYSLYLLIIT